MQSNWAAILYPGHPLASSAELKMVAGLQCICAMHILLSSYISSCL